MIRLSKNIFFLSLVLLGNCISSYSKPEPINKCYIEYISRYFGLNIDNSFPTSPKNNIVLLRYHHGIDETFLHFSRYHKKSHLSSGAMSGLYESSHYFWYLLSLPRETPRHFDFASACSLRAPPIC